MTSAREPLFEVTRAAKQFGRAAGWGRADARVTALEDVSLALDRGEALALVGESGSGKTTLGRLLLGFEQPTRGRIAFEGADLADLTGPAARAFRRRVQMVFQNPYSSLNPRRSIRDTLSAGYRIHRLASGRALDAELRDLLERVGLHESMLDRYPHEFSGGQRQRIVIARALSVAPDVLVADEPVSALDVSIQAQVLNLLRSLRESAGMAVVLITHDLRVAKFFCDRVAVLYLGRLVELGPTEQVIDRPRHPYTRMLIEAAPTGDPDDRPARTMVRGDIGAVQPPERGCVFSPRCWLRERLGNPERCVVEAPALQPLSGGAAACHFAEAQGADDGLVVREPADRRA
jgi:oligopeptide/dipeptide ABC transporter ATP-binding protein